MTDDERQKIALFRYGIIAPAISGLDETSTSLQGFFRDASTKVYKNPRGEDTKVAASTIEKWFYYYNVGGFDALLPKRRSDTGLQRKIDTDIREQILFLKKEYPRLPATLIHQKLIENGTIQPKEISLSTINRFINKMKREQQFSTGKDMRRYEREHINEVWYGDSSVGPYLTIDGKKQRTYIIALIDDASRMIVGIDIFFHDNFVNLMSVMKSAVTRFGCPKMLGFDNGSPYKNKQMELLAARIGCVLIYNQPYTPTGKAKIERWFRTMKDHWMASLSMKNFHALSELQTSLMNYVQEYQTTLHTSLNGLSPKERFFEEASIIKRLSDATIERSFLLEYERRVTADNVIVLEEIEYEVPYRYAKQRITIRYSKDFEKVYVIDPLTGEATPIKLLNKHENAHIKREKIRLIGEE
ncbi:MAG: DDE-type integrase/transposase/recombinase [Eubacteriales bacterium]